MAGIGVKLNKIYNKNTLTTNLIGMGYSTMITIAPMILVIAAIMVMQIALDMSRVGYSQRELFACTVLYIFIFALLSAAPFNSVLSRYMSDIIYEEKYEDIMPCYYIGMILNMVFSSLFGIVFCLREYLVGGVDIFFVFAGYCGYVALVLVFYQMLYLSICKDYNKISFFFLLGMAISVGMALFLVYILDWEKTISMLVALDMGFFCIACLEMALIRNYFKENSGRYRRVLKYFRIYWKLVLTNFLYTLGLYIHNFVFWTTDLRVVVARSFVSVTSYDLATCLAMFTNLSSSVIFISRIEMHFHERYKAYSEAVIGGRKMDIDLAKRRMFRQLAEELMNLVRIQFIISVIIFFLCIILLPRFGFDGLVMKIYPCLAAGYFVLFVMYAAIIFLYYFNDLTGALMSAVLFCFTTGLASVVATRLPEIWYGIGVFIGSLCGFTVAYARLRWLEKNLDEHIFCKGSLLKHKKGIPPSSKVFDRYENLLGKEEK